VTVSALSNGGTLGPSIEGYGSASGTLSLTGVITGNVQKWQKKLDGGGWTDISNTNPSLTYTNINATTSYRAEVKSGTCDSDYSSEATVTIYALPVISSADGSQYLSYGNKIRLSVGDYHTYQWKKDGVDIPGASAQTYDASEPGGYTVNVTGSSTIPPITSSSFSVYDAIPSQNQNYISTITFQKEGVNTSTLFTLRPEDYSQSTTYFDGLGRPMQTVVTMGSPSKKDIVIPVVYDLFGREFRKYLPFVPDANTGMYIDNSTIIGSNGDYTGSIAGPFYDSPETKVAEDDGDKPFAETSFEASPLNRVLEQGAPGSVWHPDGDRTIKMSYETNTTGEVLSWRYVEPTGAHPLGLVYPNMNESTAPNTPVPYDVNQLFKNVTKDEQDHEVIEYKDKEGRVVLKRVQAVDPPLTVGSDTQYASTYYI
jgi:hypothetical protein